MPITDRDFHWPTRSDYDLAMYNMHEFVLDDDIRDGRLASSESRILHFGAAVTTSLYHVEDLQGHNWMIRCFCEADAESAVEEDLEKTSPPADILSRYEKIAAFCNTHKADIPALLPVTYVRQGIEVNYFKRDFGDKPEFLKKEILPFVKMPFIRGVSLGRFIAGKCSSHSDLHDKDALRLLADAWVEMIRSLEKAHMAHGDLDLTNVKVESWQPGSLPVLRLIDYDNFYIPELAGYPQTEKGHEAFQHPYFFWVAERPFNDEMDRFSALVIYISIKVLADHPEMYRKAGADESNRLLFTTRDYQTEQTGTSSRIQELLDLNIPGLNPFLEALRYSLRNNCMPPSLKEIGGGDVELTPRKHVAPQRISDPKPVVPGRESHEEEFKPIEILEISWVDWDNAVYRVDKDEPLIKDAADPAPHVPRNWPPRPSAQPSPERNRRSPDRDPERTVRAPEPEQMPQPLHPQRSSQREQQWEQPAEIRQPQRAEQLPKVQQPQPAAQQSFQPPVVQQPQRIEQSVQLPRAEAQPRQEQLHLQGNRESYQEVAWGSSSPQASSYEDVPSAIDLGATVPGTRDYGYNAYGYENDGRESRQGTSSLNPTIIGCMAIAIVLLIIVVLVFLLVSRASGLVPHATGFAQVQHLLLVPFTTIYSHRIV